MPRRKKSSVRRLENLNKARKSIEVKKEAECGNLNLIQMQMQWQSLIGEGDEACEAITEQDILNLNLGDYENDENQVDCEVNEVREDTGLPPCQFMDGKCSVCLMDTDVNDYEMNDQLNSSGLDPKQTDKGVISKQLSAVYLVHHLLGVPLEECTRYVQRYGNPANWMTLCSSCNEMVQKARSIRNQILRLQNDLEELKRNLIERTRVKIEVENPVGDESSCSTWMTAAYEIRQFVSYAHIQSQNTANDVEASEPGSGRDSVIPIIVETKSQAHGSMHFDEFSDLDEPGFDASRSPSPNLQTDLDWLPDDSDTLLTSRKKVMKPLKKTKSENIGTVKRETEDIYKIQKKSKKAVGSLARNSSKSKKTAKNECPICFRNYETKSAWRSHIRYKHKPYLCHLYKEIPEDHVCLPGQCLPDPNSLKNTRNGSIRTKIVSKKKSTIVSVTSNKTVKGEQPSISTSEVEIPFVMEIASTAQDFETIYKVREEQFAEAEKVLAAFEPKKAADLRKTIKRKINNQVKVQLSKLKSIPCKQCSENFSRSKDLLRHINRAHTEGIKCEVCGKVVSQIRTLENHTRIAHHPKSISKCLGCKKVMGNSEVFNEHLKHNEKCRETAVKCTECTRMFPSTKSLEIHIQIRHVAPPPAPFSCSTCGKTFNDKKNLKIHRSAYHSTEQHICEKCGKSFALLHRMKDHLQTVHLNKEPDGQKFPCPVCNRIFTSKKHLARHKKLHNEESPYLCTICGKRYKVSNQLTTHYWSHDPDRYEKYSLYKYKSKTQEKREAQQNKKYSSKAESSQKNPESSQNPDSKNPGGSHQQPQPLSSTSVSVMFPNAAESISSVDSSLSTPVPLETTSSAPRVPVLTTDAGEGDKRGTQQNIDISTRDCMLPFLAFPHLSLPTPVLSSSMLTYPQYRDL